jgi:hypothetical protein
MLRIVDEEALRDELIAKGLHQAAKYRWTETAAHTTEILRSAMQAAA